MKSVLITGANRGIGLEHARRFAARGARVFAAVRRPDEADDLVSAAESGGIEILAYDAADDDAAAALKASIGAAPIDLLFANAGAMGTRQAFGATDSEAILGLIHVNALAPLKLAEAFADNVAASERKLMAFQSSEMGSISGNASGGYYDYRLSKAALNMIARGVSLDLKRRGIISVALHPGWVQTRMGGPSAPVSLDASVTGQQNLFDRLKPAHSGRFFNYNGEELPW